MRFQTLYPFHFEAKGKFEEALKEHKIAVQTIDEFLEMHKKEVVKFSRDMFERQRNVHFERIKYLREGEGDWGKGMVLTPTEMSAEEEMKGSEERCLSLVRLPQVRTGIKQSLTCIRITKI